MVHSVDLDLGSGCVQIVLPPPLLNLNTKKYITYLHTQKMSLISRTSQCIQNVMSTN